MSIFGFLVSIRDSISRAEAAKFAELEFTL